MGDFTGGVFVGVLFFFFLFVVPFTTPKDVWQGEVINKGYGLYCPDTGDFAFVGECDSE